jgi:alanine racemase
MIAQMIGRIKKIFFPSYQALNTIEVNEKNLRHNYKYLSSINKKVKIAPVLKSNAYGHGLVPTAKILENLNPPFICVDSLYEAYELTNNGIKTPILIMGFVDPVSLATKKLPYSFAVFSKEQVDTLRQHQPNSNIHIFVDTGMHREGILLEELNEFIDYIKKTDLTIEGLMSHFGESENKNNPLTKMQINNFKSAVNAIKPQWVHISNSGGVLNNYALGNMGRCGIALFGISPSTPDEKLKPTLSLKTHLVQIKDIKKGESVGYSFTYTAKKNMKIGILPIGYNDGINRRLSNKGFVKLGNANCKIIGRISMNITTIDLSDVKKPIIGDEVVVYSAKMKDKNSFQNSAEMSNTIPYTLLTGLSMSIKRVVK